MAEAAARLRELARESGRALQFRVDDYTGRTVITVTNESTGEVVRQIPAEEVLALARTFGGFGGLVDSEV
jgi:flagellar protein FlaG